MNMNDNTRYFVFTGVYIFIFFVELKTQTINYPCQDRFCTELRKTVTPSVVYCKFNWCIETLHILGNSDSLYSHLSLFTSKYI